MGNNQQPPSESPLRRKPSVEERLTKLLTTLSVAVLSAIFGAAAISKILNFAQFVRSLGSYAILPDFLQPGTALAVTVLEILIAVALIPGQTRRMAAFCGLALSCCFAVAVGYSYLSSRNADCGCFSFLQARTDLRHLVFDACVAGLFAVVALEAGKPEGKGGEASH